MPRKRAPATEKDYERAQKYIKETYKWVNVQFSQINEEEMAMYDHIAKQPESKAGYLKRLVKEDMERTQG